MVKGTYTLEYYSEKIVHDLVVVVELKMVEGMLKPRQNVWEGIATVNGIPHKDPKLKYCVNAVLAAERIGHEQKDETKKKCLAEGKSFRIKKEILK